MFVKIISSKKKFVVELTLHCITIKSMNHAESCCSQNQFTVNLNLSHIPTGNICATVSRVNGACKNILKF